MGRKYDIATCRDCGAHRRVDHREWIRASRPRCLACGGPVEASNQAANEHVDREDVGRRLSKQPASGGGGHVIT